MKYSSMNIKKQEGAVLIVSLIMLLLVTIIGIASMRDTSLQERMAGNLLDQELALQASEAALRSGEKVITQRFENNTLASIAGSPVTAERANFSGTAKSPTYKITYLAPLRTSTEAGVSTADEGALVRVEANGYGRAQDSANTPSATSTLFSIFLVEQ
jgi:type IV pilus assembly protein PilX